MAACCTFVAGGKLLCLTSSYKPVCDHYVRACISWVYSNMEVVLVFQLLVVAPILAMTTITTLEVSSSTSSNTTEDTTTESPNSSSPSLTSSTTLGDVTTVTATTAASSSNSGLVVYVSVAVVGAVICVVVIVVVVLLLRRQKRTKNESSSMEAQEETEPKEGENMYDTVYSQINHQPAKADKQSDDTHTYYNDAALSTLDRDKKGKKKEQQNKKQNATDEHNKQPSAKQKKSKDKKSKPEKTASKNGDADTYYNVISIQLLNNRNEADDNGKQTKKDQQTKAGQKAKKESDKQTPNKSAKNTQNTSTSNKTKDDDDDDVSYTDETPNAEELYSKPIKKTKPDAASIAQKPDNKKESPKKTTKTQTKNTPPKPANAEKEQRDTGKKEGEKLQVAIKKKTDDANDQKGKKYPIKKQATKESADASTEKQPKTAKKTNNKTDGKTKGSSKEQAKPSGAAKSTGKPETQKGKKQSGTPRKSAVSSTKPVVRLKPSSIPPSVPSSPTLHEDEYAYATVATDKNMSLGAVPSDSSYNEINDTNGSNADDDDDGYVLYARLDHSKEQDEEYLVEVQGSDDESEVTYAAIRRPTRPKETQAASTEADGDKTEYVDNDLYQSAHM